MIGQTISHYEIADHLGKGGMGVVYKATDTHLDREIALKFLPPHLSTDPEAKKRFIREAKAASSLDHPNICTIYDIDETDDGRLFIAMAYYRGQTLKHRLEEGSFSIDEVVAIGRQVAAGLASAHDEGIVHRDIKPDNVILTEDGLVKILDFGLAKLGEGTTLTREGSTVGTTYYMSPEQARGDAVDCRTDLWSLGVLLYELLSGERPFGAAYEQAVIYSILNEDPEAVEHRRPDVPGELAALVCSLLEKDPDARPESADDVATLLAEMDQSASGTNLSAAAKPEALIPTKWAMAAAGVIVVFLLVWWTYRLIVPGSVGSENAAVEPLDAIAVLPFSVMGDDSLSWLSHGMVDLLSGKLDGAGTIRSVDPKALLGYLARNPEIVLDPEGGRQVAGEFGASRFILGSVLEMGSRTGIRASLYDNTGQKLSEADIDYGGDEEFIPRIDELAQQLIGQQLEDPNQRLASVAVGTTTSVPALKAYLEATNASRTGQMARAFEAAGRAVELDSTFALAWYMIAKSGFWISEFAASSRANAKAVLYAENLSRRARRYVEGSDAFENGRFLDAQSIYLEILARYPDDIEARGQLADLYYHYGPAWGVSLEKAMHEFEQVLRYDETNDENFNHLFTLYLRYNRLAALDSLVGPRLESESLNPMYQSYYRLIGGSAEERAAGFRGVGAMSAVRGMFYFWIELIATEKVFLSQVLSRSAMKSTEPIKRIMATTMYAYSSQMLGQNERADSALTAIEPEFAGNALAVRVMNAALPAFELDSDRLDRVEAAVVAWDTTTAPIIGAEGSLHVNEYEAIQAYYRAVLSWRRGDMPGFEEGRSIIEERATETGETLMTGSLLSELEALVLWQAGSLDEAIDAMMGAVPEANFIALNASPILGRPMINWAMAEMLAEAGRLEEALGWFEGLGMSFSASQWLGPSLVRRAEIYEQLGDTEAAINHYERFIRLWESSDLELQPRVDDARRQLDRLVMARSREPVS